MFSLFLFETKIQWLSGKHLSTEGNNTIIGKYGREGFTDIMSGFSSNVAPGILKISKGSDRGL